MKKILVRTLSILSLTFSFFGTASAITISVNIDGSGDYTSIQSAINAAGNGDTINVAAGDYIEGTSVYRGNSNSTGLLFERKSGITLTGSGRSTVVDFANSYYGLMFDASHNIMVEDLSIWNAGDYFSNGLNSPSNISVSNVLFGGTTRWGHSDYYNALTMTNVINDPNFVPPAAVPVPAAVWLFGSALMGLVGVRRKKA